MKTETLNNPEIRTSTDIAKAKREFYRLTAETENDFIEENVDPDTVSKGEYWGRVAANGRRAVNEAGSSLEGLTYSKLLEATALAPLSYLAEQQLARMKHRGEDNRDMRKRLVGIACQYNRAISEYAQANPDITAHELSDFLTGIVRSGLEKSEQEVRPVISSTIKGLQQEVAMGDLLFAAIECRFSSVEEDMAGGDYIMLLPDGRGAKVDIKSSKTGLAGGDNDMVNVDKGRIVIKSLFADAELGGKFHPSKEAIDQNIDIMQGLLSEAYRQSLDGRKLNTVEY